MGNNDKRLACYLDRDRNLRQLGYASYRAYLASDRWAGIRMRVLKRCRWRCQKCHGQATQVHHLNYKASTLKGFNISGLTALCGTCHLDAEFDGERKVETDEANERAGFKRMRVCSNCNTPLAYHKFDNFTVKRCKLCNRTKRHKVPWAKALDNEYLNVMGRYALAEPTLIDPPEDAPKKPIHEPTCACCRNPNH